MPNNSHRLDKEQLGDKGLFEDIAEGLLNAKVVIAFISDEYAKVKTMSIYLPTRNAVESLTSFAFHGIFSPLLAASLRTASWNFRMPKRRCGFPSSQSLWERWGQGPSTAPLHAS